MQTAGEETQSCQPTSLRNYWRHWPYKLALFSRLWRRQWEWITADFLNHKLSWSGKHIQPTLPSSKCWSFLCCGKHTDDEWRAVDDNQQFPQLSSNHQLPAQSKVSWTEVQCSRQSWLQIIVKLCLISLLNFHPLEPGLTDIQVQFYLKSCVMFERSHV